MNENEWKQMKINEYDWTWMNMNQHEDFLFATLHSQTWSQWLGSPAWKYETKGSSFEDSGVVPTALYDRIWKHEPKEPAVRYCKIIMGGSCLNLSSVIQLIYHYLHLIEMWVFQAVCLMLGYTHKCHVCVVWGCAFE